MAAVRLFLWFVKWTVILAVLVFAVHFWITNKGYVFSVKSITEIAQKHTDGGKDRGYDVRKAYHKIHQDLLKKYPGHILAAKDLEWVFLNSGGWMGAMCLLHASVTEYVLFFGTAIDTSGHSGRYWANITDVILTGEFRKWHEGELDVHIYKSGDVVPHTWGQATGVNFKAGTWMVEYGRGFIPSTLTFALADTVFSTTDFITIFNVFRIYMKALVMEMGYYISHLTG